MITSMLQPAPDTSAAEIARFLKADDGIDAALLSQVAPLLMNALNKVVINSNGEALKSFVTEELKFLENQKAQRLIYAACTAFAVRWTKQNGRDELSQVVGALQRARLDADELLLD